MQPINTARAIQAVVAPQKREEAAWRHLSTNHPAVYEAFQTVQDANRLLAPEVLHLHGKDHWHFMLSMNPNDPEPRRANPVVLGYNNGRFYNTPPGNVVEVNSPEDAIRSIYNQAEFRGHIVFVAAGVGLDGQSRYKVAPGPSAVRPGLVCSIEDRHNLVAG